MTNHNNNNNKKNSDDIRHFKLVSGEEIISNVLGKDNSEYILEMPLKMHIVINARGQQFFFTKWQPLTDTEICSIFSSHIISYTVVKDEIKKKYNMLCEEYRLEDEAMGDEDILEHDDDEEDNEDNLDNVGNNLYSTKFH